MIRKTPVREAWKCRPNPSQELLLQASLLRGERSVRAWEQWISAVDIDTLDGGSIRLLPLLYASLKGQGINHPEMQRFKGVHRHTWSKNQILLQDIAPALTLLEEAKIPTVLLKGAALIHEYYADCGLRPMGDFDLLVPVPEAWQAMEILRGHGWRLAHGEEIYREERVREDREQAFLSARNQRLDLHWHALDSFFDRQGAEKSDVMFWGGARATVFQGVSTSIPDPADLLLHVCVHGAEGHPAVPPLRWAADSVVLLNKSGLELDWDRLLYQAREQRLSLPLYDTLGYLAQALDAPIPRGVLEGLKSARVSRREQSLYALWVLPPTVRRSLILPATPLEALKSHYRSYAEWAAGGAKASAGQTAGHSVLHYLQAAWGLESRGQIPRTILRRVSRKIMGTLSVMRNRWLLTIRRRSLPD